MIIADSDVLIDYLRGGNPRAEQVAFELQHGALGTTAITAFELEAGARSERQRVVTQDLLAALQILPLGREAARRGGVIWRQLTASGQQIGMADCMIAAICIEHDQLLFTRNRRHFERIEGLRFSAGSVG